MPYNVSEFKKSRLTPKQRKLAQIAEQTIRESNQTPREFWDFLYHFADLPEWDSSDLNRVNGWWKEVIDGDSPEWPPDLKQKVIDKLIVIMGTDDRRKRPPGSRTCYRQLYAAILSENIRRRRYHALLRGLKI